MTNVQEAQPRIPVICVDPSSVAGAELFDPNSWFGHSKGVVHSCWTEYSVLHHCVGQLAAMQTSCAQRMLKPFNSNGNSPSSISVRSSVLRSSQTYTFGSKRFSQE